MGQVILICCNVTPGFPGGIRYDRTCIPNSLPKSKTGTLFRRQITGHYSSTDNKFYSHNIYVDN